MNMAEKNTVRLLTILLLLVALMLYARAVWYEYVWDDLIFFHIFIQYRGFAGAVRSFTEPLYVHSGYYRPLAVLSFVVSDESTVQHGINVLLHALNTVLVLYVARTLMPRSKAGLWTAWLGALLFAVHPVAVEPTVWVSGRFDTLMCTFVLGTCLAALGGELTRRRLALVFVLFACAMGSKESAVGLPVALPFLLLLKWRLEERDTVQIKAQAEALVRVFMALALALALYIAVRLAVVRTLFAAEGEAATFGGGGVLDILNVAALAVTAFVKLIVAPLSHSAPLHPFNYEIGSGVQANTLIVVVGVLVLLALIFLKKPRLNFPLVLLAALAMSWPTLHIIGIPNGENIISDRYALAPLALLLAGLAAVAGTWVARRAPELGAGGQRVLLYAAVAMLLWTGMLAAYSSATIPLWRSEMAFWEFVYKQFPDSAYTRIGHIGSLMKQNRWQEAEAEIENIYTEHPDLLKKMSLEDAGNWMLIRAKVGNYAGAVELFSLVESLGEEKLRKVHPRVLGQIYGMRGVIEYEAGHMDQAEYYLEKSVQISPENVELGFIYAQILHVTGKIGRSNDVFEKALLYASDERATLEKQKREIWRQQAPVQGSVGSVP